MARLDLIASFVVGLSSGLTFASCILLGCGHPCSKKQIMLSVFIVSMAVIMYLTRG